MSSDPSATVARHETTRASDASLRAIADALCLAATPIFAGMALLSAFPGDGPLEAFCSATHGASALNGMALMYGLMSVFHSAPWLRRMSRRREGPMLAGQTNGRVVRRISLLVPAVIATRWTSRKKNDGREDTRTGLSKRQESLTLPGTPLESDIRN
jgi:hypothetical protein